MRASTRPGERSRFHGLATIVLFLSGFWLLLGAESACYAGAGVRTEGVVLRKSTSTTSGATRSSTPTTTYHVEYQFTIPEGRAVTGNSEVRQAFWTSLNAGGRVPVEYVRAFPSYNRIPDQFARSGVWLMMSVAGFALAMWLRKRGPSPTS